MELLAPAGNFAKIKYAIAFGADSVYLGLPDFSLRARVNDFTPAKLKEAVKYAHNRGKKVYVTVNIYAHNYHLPKLEQALKQLNNIRPDAVIISDPGVLAMAKKYLKKIDLHLSTQANCTNWQAAKFWHQQGIKRLILARELSLKEIAEIHKKVPGLELEAFVHGAMCISYSGRCLLSAYYNNRSANLGDCSHPCRWAYKLYMEEATRPGQYLPVEEDKNGTYILSSKDICMIKYLPDLVKAGVKHFKIEGRTKSISYLANVVKVYREAIDLTKLRKPTKVPAFSKATVDRRKVEVEKLFKELNKISNREFTTGFYFGTEKLKMQKYDAPYVRPDLEFCGEILGRKDLGKGNWEYEIKIHNVVNVGDKIEFIVPQEENFVMVLPKMYDIDKKKYVDEVHGGQDKAILVQLRKEIPVMTILRKKILKKAEV
ncbi:MAG: U32 family peptidase C-terminal domain-containing protein [Candidatus Parcubacteria bacterium]|nr:U32 family peptidase C-terminal domain-containing protein [Candidatus Parcubacteria bacterium]